jgi:hypothetical protein
VALFAALLNAARISDAVTVLSLARLQTVLDGVGAAKARRFSWRQAQR